MPPWLPSSLVLADAQKDTEIAIEYFLIAEYIPIDACNVINCCRTPPPHKYELRWGPYWLTTQIQLSKINTCRLINIFQPYQMVDPVPKEISMSSDVGGFMGMFTDKSTSKIVFPKNNFHFGEKTNILFLIDNTGCSKKVDKVKVKLYRRITTRTTVIFSPTVAVNDCYVVSQKFPGCPSKQKSEINVEFTFPTHEALNEDAKHRLHIDQQHCLLANSFSGKLFAVEYFLKAFIKYDAWNEFGEGRFVFFPIQLSHPQIREKASA